MGPLPPVADLRAPDVLDVIRNDKKVVAGRLHFVLCAGLGRIAQVTDVTADEIGAALAAAGLVGTSSGD
jgi:3-dehydroquinate synthetase